MSLSTKSFITSISLLSLLSALPSLVSAHGHVKGITINGQDFPGFPSDNPGAAPYSSVAWAVEVPDNSFVRDYSSPDIICHKQAVPGTTSATVEAGGSVDFQWTDWPTHQGPIVDYMAECPGNCEDVDKTQLQWFKVAEQGLISTTGCNVKGNSGCWAIDKFIQAGSRWSVKVPSDLKAGNYVMRHEPINLDFPGQSQNYPACVNLVVTGGGSSTPEGVVGTSLYTGQEEGLNFLIYDMKSDATYPIPGPPVATMSGGSSDTYGSDVAASADDVASSADDVAASADDVAASADDDDTSADEVSECSSGKLKLRARKWVA